MTIGARIKRYLGEGDLGAILADEFPGYTGAMRTISWASPRDGFALECEVVHPPSARGRTVVLRLTEKDRDDLLVALRREAIRARTATS